MAKYVCTRDFSHSGVKSYRAGEVYDLNEKTAALFRGMKKDKDDAQGAMKFFKERKEGGGAEPAASAADEVAALKAKLAASEARAKAEAEAKAKAKAEDEAKAEAKAEAEAKSEAKAGGK
jgi:colicin import membrane protein